MNLYKLVTTENVDLNYKAFKKDELIDCISNLSDTYFRLKKENEQLQQENKKYKEAIDKAIEYIENDLQSFLYSIEYKKLLDILKGVK